MRSTAENAEEDGEGAEIKRLNAAPSPAINS
jgi:hypothetical protein